MNSAAHRLVREPAVAGAFYPAGGVALGRTVDELLATAARISRSSSVSPAGRRPKALVVPHAGYVYSGPIAATAFREWMERGASIERVVLVGPSHRVYVEGVVAPAATSMRTPLGDVEIDVEAIDRAGIRSDERVHRGEHSLEVELPFLLKVAPRARVVPLAVGEATPEDVGKVLELLWGGDETVIVISSDLSHYLPYERAASVDRVTASRIVARDAEPLAGEDACGAAGINGLTWVARRKKLAVRLLDLRNSGDTAGSRDRVVGYGAFALYEEGAS